MGFGGISVWQLLIVLVIVVLLFGTKKLRSLGGDLGSAIRSFKSSLRDGEEDKDNKSDQLQHDVDNDLSTTSSQKEKDADKSK
ncbi:twin-arginine translocase TatA/TatE family subunit [Methylophaga sp. OBS3]|uniref:twin-arginine translocase TatA/TatE family subunit n=1 Tax=Methylophaga sp. OBS3 TaxID=2991934 RepID=UPI0022506723|nr:twin-arginine translocase TatA/TatE family subunit [Methylophaga sp. OBS3]MCX4189754.1 twin-arginine translocase TatA/TatE family subunit [Methylophaga sp. OBS3]